MQHREFVLPHHEDTFDKFLLDIEGIENGTVMSLEDVAFGAPPPQAPVVKFVPMPHWNEAPCVNMLGADGRKSPLMCAINTSSSGNSGETRLCIDADSSHSDLLPMQPMNQAHFFMPQAMPAAARASYHNLQAMAMNAAMPMTFCYPSFMPSSMIPGMTEIPSEFTMASITPQGRLRQEALIRYREKRAKRMIIGGGVRQKVRYTLRKLNADHRPRIKGRFIKKGEIVPGLESTATTDDAAEKISVDGTDTEEEMEEEEDSS